MIDKVRKAMLARESGGAPAAKPAAGAAAAAAAPPTSTVPSIQSPFQQPKAQTPAAPPVAAAPAQRAPVTHATQAAQPRNATLSFEGGPAGKSAPAPVVTAAAAKPAGSGAVGAAVNGQLAGKLGELGLTAQQADAVLALSREVVERVVWEVVPQLAEAIIKEEIARLTRDG
jgi:hypothetical protein